VRGFDATGGLDCQSSITELFPKLALCGASAREIATFIPAGVPLMVAETCTPAPNIQAMLVTRSGHHRLDATAVRDYLQAGGIVITEYSASIPVYNKVFATSFPEWTEVLGPCNDNVNPIVQHNDGDPFWQANPFVQENVGGCGFNLFGLPDITSLGSASESNESITLAYVRVGNGRLWLVESDWADGDATFTDQSLRLMRYMVRTR
jgi:hypothetical protein